MLGNPKIGGRRHSQDSRDRWTAPIAGPSPGAPPLSGGNQPPVAGRIAPGAFGTLIDTLKRTGTYDNTLIVYLSDNDAPFPGSKTNVYEPGIRLPLIVKKPGQARRGIVNTAMISWVDITPTILDFAGVQLAPRPPSQPVAPGRFTNETPAIQGRSFCPGTPSVRRTSASSRMQRGDARFSWGCGRSSESALTYCRTRHYNVSHTPRR